MSVIYIASIIVKPLKGCEFDYKQFDALQTQCFIPARDEKHAAEILFDVLEELNFDLIQEEWLIKDSELDMSHPDNVQAKDLVEEAREEETTLFSDFFRVELPEVEQETDSDDD
ncbi:hypothetical protein [Pleionea sp. CnH1-48]|uniref:hypothetical protein n=1 Tax=Pleionea sp. CnH1-48 TaxID=2954494 RepID=UPI0020971F6F|nr:hypothetical protein [Pleionea sp. CnH1-48]MCO7226463.1 hypothetical protein [Pleionea sp. CnH1-48]